MLERLAPRPTRFPDETSYRDFVERVVIGAWLARVPDARQDTALVDTLVAQARDDSPPWTLDYVRLNLGARRPAP